MSRDGVGHEIDCDFIAGCDGQTLASVGQRTASSRRTFERIYPFGWLGLFCRRAPVSHE